MCGRFAFYSPHQAVTDIFGVDFPLAIEPRFNIAPSQFIVVLRTGTQGRLEPAVLKWGLIPSWAKDPRIGNRMINARAETVHEKPSFRAAFKRRRCVIIADGFYEWRKDDGGKTPYFISMQNDAPFAMAGLWEYWQGEDGAALETCTIITTASNDVMLPLHHRMPVILSPAKAAHWSGSDCDRADAAHAVLGDWQNDGLKYRAVSRAVNNPRNDGPELLEK